VAGDCCSSEVFVLIPIAMFLSQSKDLLDILYYGTGASPSSFVLFYYVLSLAGILTRVMLILFTVMICSSSMMCCYLSCKIIRSEAPKRQRGRWREAEKKVKDGKYRYFNSTQR
jgi:ABC-type thiamin/hydroxymethylpyrimidine transport system permease subunit